MSDYSPYYELKEFLVDITQIETEFGSRALLFKELGIDSIAFFELLFFIKTKIGENIDPDLLSFHLMEIVAEKENIPFSHEDRKLLMETRDYFSTKALEIMEFARVEHIAMLLGYEIPEEEKDIIFSPLPEKEEESENPESLEPEKKTEPKSDYLNDLLQDDDFLI